jgi:hypothetical protein
MSTNKYSEKWLEIDRPRPLTDSKIEQTIQHLLAGNWQPDTSDSIYDQFKDKCEKWIFDSTENCLVGQVEFTRKDISIGCTQFIDNLYMQGPVQVLYNDYRYHSRLGLAFIKSVGSLIPDIPLIIALPFPSTGDIHTDMDEILNECLIKKIPVHIDGAWISCSRNIKFDFSHPAISSFAISLSKGLGLGWNRIGLRWTRSLKPDSITIMNDFRMNCRVLTMVGLHFIDHFPSDYFWKTYGHLNAKVCRDFDLTPTPSIHLAMRNNQPVGISSLIRYLAEHE